MNKRNLIIIVIVVALAIGLFLIIKGKNNEENENPEEVVITDAIKFKEDYESLNGTQNSSGKDIRNVTISDDNPMVYKTAEEIVEKIENKESFVVYFGYNSCPWCRSVVSKIVEVASDLGLKEVYYVDIHDIRDTRELDEKNKVVTTKEGSESYNKLLELLDNVLEDYTTTNSKGKEVSLKEKRIYAPNIVAVIEGKAEALTEGTSDEQDDAYMELSEEMLKESYQKIGEVMEIVARKLSSCDDEKSC